MKSLLILSAIVLLAATIAPAQSQGLFKSPPHLATCTASPRSPTPPSCAGWRTFIQKTSCSTACTYIGNKCMDCEGHACSTC
jgi:hypothetical protein